MAFPSSIRHSWVVKSVATEGMGTHELKPFQFGIFNEDWKAITAGTFQSSNFIRFVSGSPNTGQIPTTGNLRNFANNGQVDESFKTPKLHGRDLNSVRVAKPVKTPLPVIRYLGYDGIDSSKSLNIECGKTYGIQINIYGLPVSMLYPGGQMSEIIEISAPCCDDCADGCDIENLCGSEMDTWVNRFNSSTFASQFVLAEKVVDSCGGPVPVETSFTNYSLTLCDEGDEIALARVVNTYPTLNIKRTSRLGGNSTYEVCRLTADGLPTAYDIANLYFPADCGECPSGYTVVEGGDIWYVTITNTNTDLNAGAWLTAVNTFLGSALATSATKIGYAYGSSTYIVVVPADTAIPTVTGGSVINTGQTKEDYCTSTTYPSTAWVAGDVYYKITRTMQVQIAVPDCAGDPADRLAEVEALIGARADYVASSAEMSDSTDCMEIYTVEQYNNACLEDGCDTLAVAKFDTLPAFMGEIWTEVPSDTAYTPETCSCGFKFTGAFIDTSSRGCAWDPCDFINYDPVRFEVGLVEFTREGIKVPIPCDGSVAPITNGPEPRVTFLSGQEVLREIITYRYYKSEHFFSNSVEDGFNYQAAEGLKYGIDVDKFYYAVYTNWNVDENWRDNTMDLGARRELALYFEESDIMVMQQVLNQLNTYATSVGINLPPVTI